MVLIRSKAIRTVVHWQAYTTLGVMLIAGLAAGPHGAVSAMLGGLVSLIASLVYGLIIARAGVTSAGNVLITAMRAETSKIASMVLLLWLVLTVYKSIVAIAFFSAFVIAVLMFTLAFFVPDE